jgi:predicted PilT family ATPase
LHTLELLPQQLVSLIKKGDKGRILQLIKHYNIKNVASLRTSGSFEEQYLEIKGVTAPYLKKLSQARASGDDHVQLHMYDTTMWNPILFAIYF